MKSNWRDKHDHRHEYSDRRRHTDPAGRGPARAGPHATKRQAGALVHRAHHRPGLRAGHPRDRRIRLQPGRRGGTAGAVHLPVREGRHRLGALAQHPGLHRHRRGHLRHRHVRAGRAGDHHRRPHPPLRPGRGPDRLRLRALPPLRVHRGRDRHDAVQHRQRVLRLVEGRSAGLRVGRRGGI